MVLNPHARSWFPEDPQKSSPIPDKGLLELAFSMFVPSTIYYVSTAAPQPPESSNLQLPPPAAAMVLHFYDPNQFPPFPVSNASYPESAYPFSYAYYHPGFLHFYRQPPVAVLNAGLAVEDCENGVTSTVKEVLPKQALRIAAPASAINKTANFQEFQGKKSTAKKIVPLVSPQKEDLPTARYCTTVMVMNVPNKYRRNSFMEFLDQCCLEHQLEYDFVYLPMDFKTGNNLGYAFVNCTSPSVAMKMKEFFQGYKWGTYQTQYGTYTSNKISDAAWARIQGKDALMRHFAKSLFSCRNYEFLPVVISPPRNGSNTAAASSLTIIGGLQGNAIHFKN